MRRPSSGTPASVHFTPALYHLVTTALRRGEPAAARAYFDTLRTIGADSTLQLRLALMFDCPDERLEVCSGPKRSGAILTPCSKPPSRWLITTLAQRACAQAAYRAVLQTPGVESRWGALLGLQGLLVAEGRYGELDRLFASPQAADLPGRLLYLWDAGADSALDGVAAKAAVERGSDYAAMGGPNLWLLGEWEAHRGNASAVSRISGILDSLARRGSRRDSLLARIMAAQAARAAGDTALALARLGEAEPTAPRAELIWQPWEAMVGERLALAQILFARRSYAAADSVAAGLDNDRSVAFLPYLPAALALRIRSADAQNNRALATQLRLRLDALHAGSAAPQ